MATYYLDVDDEITTAASRIRKATDSVVALVLPSGSRVATSRINFRLLAREAQGAHRRLVIVAPEGSVRALAASAGLPVFGTVSEYESASEEAATAAAAVADGVGGARAAGAAPRGGAGAAAGSAAGTAAAAAASGEVAAALDELGATVPGAARGTSGNGRRERAASPRDGASPRGADAAPREARRRRRAPLVALAVLAVLALAVVGAGVGAYLYLPSATIVVTPRHETIGPYDLTVRVDPTITAVEPDAAAIPGQVLQFPEQAANTFPATGKRVDRTSAKGSVSLQSCDTTAGHVVPRGTNVSTVTGVRFTTDHDVQLARATIDPVSHSASCGSGATTVTAATPGSIGNVAAGAIVRMPAGWDPTIFFVQNPAATSGGSETTHTIIQQSDVDKATPQLTKQIQDAFAADIANPTNLPSGMQLFPQTAQLGPITISPAASTLVNTEQPSFELVATATGTALAANVDQAKAVAQAKIAANVGSGYTLEQGSVQIATGTPTVDGQSVTVPVSATALRIRALDAAAMRDEVKGKTADQARTILGGYGDVKVTLWPDWVSTVPTNDSRLDVTIGTPSEASPAPLSSPSGTSASGSSASAPSASPLASPSTAPSASQ